MTTGNSDEIAKEVKRLIEKVKEEKDEFQRLAGNRLDALEAIGREVGISSYGRTGFEPVRERVAQLVGEHKAAVRLNKEKVEFIQELEDFREADGSVTDHLRGRVKELEASQERAVRRAVKRLSREVTFGNGQASDPPELIDYAVKIVLSELAPDEKPQTEEEIREWADRLAADSVAAGEAEYGGKVIHNPNSDEKGGDSATKIDPEQLASVAVCQRCDHIRAHHGGVNGHCSGVRFPCECDGFVEPPPDLADRVEALEANSKTHERAIGVLARMAFRAVHLPVGAASRLTEEDAKLLEKWKE